MSQDWFGLVILFSFVFLGMWLSFLNQAIRGTLWGGNVERNPFTADFWSDLYLYFFVEKKGRTVVAVVVAFTTAVGLANGLIDVQQATFFKLFVAGVTAGFVADITVNGAFAR